MIDTTAHRLHALGVEPVSTGHPCGENVRYQPDFELLEAELAKQESLNAETVDWQVVDDIATRILQSESKDLLVAAYLCNALLINEGYSGLAVGLKILSDMVSNHWDDLFPPVKRMRARRSALTWLAEKAGGYVTENPPSATDNDTVLTAAETLKQLDQALVDKMGDQAPLLTDLIKPLQDYRRGVEAAAKKTGEPAAAAPAKSAESVSDVAPAPAPAGEPNAAVAAVAVGTALESETDCRKVLRQLQSGLRQVAGFLLAQKLEDVRPYRLNRLAAWMTVEKAPPVNNGVTQIVPPAPERLKFFERKREQGDYAALVPELEKTLARSPFWIDGHYEVVRALRALGSGCEPAAQIVVRELKTLLARIPELQELAFADQTPFASDQTRLWLDAEVLVTAGEGSATVGAPAGDAAPWDAALVDARQVAAGGKTEEALAVINAGLTAARSGRDQSYWRCALAELLLQIGQAESASAILESLSQQARSRQMTDWEPELMSRIYNQLFLSYQKQRKSKTEDRSLKEKAEQAFEQLCWFDPVTALSLKGG